MTYFSIFQALKKIGLLTFAEIGMIIMICHAQDSATLVISRGTTREVISKNLYGMFSEHLGRDIYGGIWVGRHSTIPNKDGIRLDIVNALKKIHLPVLRWPGGCFADMYHWMDGIGPVEKRPSTINTYWGNVPESNHFGTHEFMELCHLIGCQPYIAGNMGSGTVREMSQWVEYLNANIPSTMTALRRKNGRDSAWKVKYWGVGNESWGCGGVMTPAYYSNEYRRYASFCKDYPGAHLLKIASGPNGNDTNWMAVLIRNIPHNLLWGISLHYYTIPTGNWSHKGSATLFGEDQYFSALKNSLKMQDILHDQEKVMDTYDPLKRIALVVDEWGVWTDAEPGTNPAFLYQQNSLRDALAAASTLNIFNNHCDRVRMANLAQTVNVLQSVILTRGKKMILTPTYYVYKLFRGHQDATLLPEKLSTPEYTYRGQGIAAVNCSASMDTAGIIHITLVNLDPGKTIKLNTRFVGLPWSYVKGRILTSTQFNDVNSFRNPGKVRPVAFNGFNKQGKELIVRLPPKSVVALQITR
ncbi:MAG TPA: alpha-L-arabinofuranosidase C-terminal domain-containing protein [Chitinophagaceae bacterium]|nr:alpha-L-arabinofuranosidase C-terminal domain-containing protein [Chitinophagaceae bacterium]